MSSQVDEKLNKIPLSNDHTFIKGLITQNLIYLVGR